MAPVFNPLISWTGESSAVTNMTGMDAVRGSSFNAAHTAYPSMPGIMTSSRMTSGFDSMAR
jgi:hypothetical protein